MSLLQKQKLEGDVFDFGKFYFAFMKQEIYEKNIFISYSQCIWENFNLVKDLTHTEYKYCEDVAWEAEGFSKYFY